LTPDTQGHQERVDGAAAHGIAKHATAAMLALFQMKIADLNTVNAQPSRQLMKINQSHVSLSKLYEWANQ
jgi:hypothetical protein